MKEKKYRITLTVHQLMLIANCVEDCHRFAAGQTEMSNTVGSFKHDKSLDYLLKNLHQHIVPELLPGQDYDWAGSGCKNKHQRQFIAETYPLYREIYHKVINEGVYKTPTLTCEEGGPLPIIEEVEEEPRNVVNMYGRNSMFIENMDGDINIS